MLQVRLNASLNAYVYYAFAQSINQTLGLHYIMAEKKKVYKIPGTELVRNIKPGIINPKQPSCKKMCGPKKAIVKKDVKSKVAAKKWL